MVVKLDPFLNARFCIRSGLSDVQVDAFVFQRPPEPLDKDVIEEADLRQQVFPASSIKDRETTAWCLPRIDFYCDIPPSVEICSST
ncbi:hypothetical protein NBRC116589_18270 [Ruegeria sp. HU-ET01832]